MQEVRVMAIGFPFIRPHHCVSNPCSLTDDPLPHQHTFNQSRCKLINSVAMRGTRFLRVKGFKF